MTLNNKFDAIVKTIVANSQTEIDIKNELVHIFNGNKTYQFQDGTVFNRDSLVEVMVDTIFEYQDETKDYVRSLKERTIENIDNFDDALFMVSNYDNNQIKSLIYIEPKFTSLVIDGLLEFYHTKKDFYFKTNQNVETNTNNNNEQEHEVDYSDYENAVRSKNNLELLDEALLRTQEKGFIGRQGYEQRPYNDHEMSMILINIFKGNYNYITNNPLVGYEKYRNKLSQVSRGEIFAEVIKNSVRIISMANNERELSILTAYNIMPLDIQRLSSLVTEITKNSLNDGNVESVIDSLGETEKYLLSSMFIASRKDDLIKNKLMNATMGDEYHALLINNLNKIGSEKAYMEGKTSKR